MLTIVAVLIVAGSLGAGVYWFVAGMNDANPPTSNSKQSTKSASKSSQATSSASTADWKQLTDNKVGFTVRVPNSWYTYAADKPGGTAYLQNYDAETAEGRGYDSVKDKGKFKIDVAVLSGQGTLDQAVDKLLIDPLTPAKDISKIKVKINGYNAYKVTYFTTANRAFYCIDKSGTIYYISATNDYESQKETFHLIVSTFKFL